MPAYNDASVVAGAIESVRRQTWRLLELLIVDDCSTDHTMEVTRRYAEADDRIHIFQTESNAGPYVARNVALTAARGEYVTCHDADDWSHPEKIATQVEHLQEHPEAVANTSQQARATDDLSFCRRNKPGRIVQINISSFMFRREPVLQRVGYWDSVRFAGDGEMIRRIRRAFGDEAVVDLPTGPLSFQRQTATSLTGNDAFGYPGYFMGARREHLEASQHYHETAKTLYFPFPMTERPFPVPAPMRLGTRRGGRRHFDVIIASDFRLRGGTTMSNVEEIKAHRRLGLTTGLVQLSRYDFNHETRVHPLVRDRIDGESVDMIVYGEHASCDVLLVRHPPVLQVLQRYVPHIDARDIRVIVNQTPKKDYGPEGYVYFDLATCAAHMKRYVGAAGRWHPIGPLVRQALLDYHAHELPEIELDRQDWFNIIDVEEWRRPGRPTPAARPRIGRHSRDQYVKWPNDPAVIRAAYPRSCDVHVLGGADTPRKVLGRLPRNWHVHPFGSISPQEFLRDLDVFVYFTHPDWVESFGRVILEAMAAGVPVILPHQYEPLFTEAAIYAEPDEVAQEVDRLTRDDALYEEQVHRAWSYVEQHFGYTHHAERLGLGRGRRTQRNISAGMC